MSWQTYIDEQLMSEIEGHSLKAAAILGHDGAVFAQSSDFPQFEPDQISAVMDEFNNPDSHARTGLHLGEDKYMLILGEPGSVIRGKKGNSGITVKKTTETLIFGIYESPMTQEKCNMVVEKLGDYLVDEGH